MAPLREWWDARSRNARIAIGAGGGAALLVVAAVAIVLLSGDGGEASPPVVVATVVPTTSAEATSTATAAATSTATATPTGEPGFPTLRALTDLKSRVGDPPTARRGRVRIPRIGVDAPLGVRVVGGDLNLAIPAGPADVVLYDFASWPQWGGDLGSGGNAILSGHVDYNARVPYAQVNYRGPGVFRDLELLSSGDTIDVQLDGRTYSYTVAWRQKVPGAGGDWARIMSRNVEGDALTLITCGGDFNFQTLEYSHRVVVRALRS